MAIKSNILNNGIASILQKGVRMLEQLLLVPFFITSWGAAYYGEWLTLTIIPDVIAFSNLGFGSASANTFVLYYAAKKYQKASNVRKVGIYMISFVVFLAIFASLIGLFLLSYFKVFENSLIDEKSAIIAVSILIFARLQNFYLEYYDGLYRAARKASLSINLMSIKSFLSVVVGLITLLLGYRIVIFAVSQLFIISCFTFFYAFKARKVCDSYGFVGVWDKDEYKNIINKGLGFLLMPVWQVIYFQGTTFVVRIVLGPESVAVYNTVRTLSRSINQFFSVVNISIFPELQYEIGQGNLSKAKKIYRMSMIIVFIIALIGCLVLTLFGLWFYKIWTKGELDLPPLMWYIFVIGILFNSIWWVAGVIFRAINEPHRFALAGLFGALISVFLSYWLSHYYGLIGAAIGAISLEVLMAFFVLPYGFKILDMKLSDVFRYGLNDFRHIYFLIKNRFEF